MKKIFTFFAFFAFFAFFILLSVGNFSYAAEQQNLPQGEFISKNAWVDIYFLANDKNYFQFKLSAFNNLQLCEIDGSANFVGKEKNQAGYANQECSIAFKFADKNQTLQLTVKNCENICSNDASKVLNGEYKKPKP